MINLFKKRIALYWFFSILIMNIFIFLPLESRSTNPTDLGEEFQNGNDNDNQNLKSSALSMIVAPIEINDDGTNNWAWAKTQPWCIGSGTALDPYLLKNLVINGGGTGACISISSSDAYVTIENCHLFNGEFGIYLYEGDNVQILNNEIHDCIYRGTSIKSSGIYQYHDGALIKGNKISYCDYGIYLENTDGNEIYNNEIVNNNKRGMMNYQSWYLQISGNFIHKNSNDWGIYQANADSCTIWGNVIRDNSDGIYLDGSTEKNNIYNNFFKGNPGFNAYDSMPENMQNEWNNTLIGNYWDDYAGSDIDGDGIGDADYDIPGLAGNEDDHLPIYDKWAPTMNIINPKPGQVCYSSGPGYSISASDNYTFHTWYTLDGGKTNYTDWSFTGTIDQEAWDAVGNGQVTIRFYIDDKPGHTVFQDVVVYKEPLPPGLGKGTDDEEDKYFTLLSPLGVMLLGGIAVPVGIILRHELKRTPKEKGRWITKAGQRIFIKGKKKIKK